MRRGFGTKVSSWLRGLDGLNEREKSEALVQILRHFDRQSLAKAFDRADENRDGVLTAKEFENFVKPIRLKRTMQTLDGAADPPSKAQLRQLMICTAIPFVGFGFLDNFIMLTAGDYIECQLGSAFHITTLCAAGLGNTLSDVAGLGLGNFVQTVATKVGFPPPKLSHAQVQMKVTKSCTLIASMAGISAGCFLGMAPLVM